MTTAKMKFLLGYNLKIVIPCGQWTFAGESVPGVFWLGGLPSILEVGKTLSSGFTLKIILHRVVQ